MAERLIILTRPDEPRPVLDLDVLPDGGLDVRCREIVIRTHADDGRPLLIAKGYVDHLKTEGWVGVDQIPAECLVDDPPKGFFGRLL